MTPLSDTHARARKLKDVIDKRVRARVSKQIALPVPMSRKVFFEHFFLHFFHAYILVVFLTIFGTKMEAKMLQNCTQKRHYSEICFLHAPDQKYIILGPSDPQIHASRSGEVHFHTFSRFSYFSQKCEIFVSKMTSFWHTWTA